MVIFTFIVYGTHPADKATPKAILHFLKGKKMSDKLSLTESRVPEKGGCERDFPMPQPFGTVPDAV